MINSTILIKIARKWNRVAATRRRRISAKGDVDGHKIRRSSSIAGKGHFTVYTVDQERFTIPLRYLDNGAIRELFEMSEQEYGLQSNRPITLPCDAAFMEGLVQLIRACERSEFEKRGTQIGSTQDEEMLLVLLPPIRTGRRATPNLQFLKRGSSKQKS